MGRTLGYGYRGDDLSGKDELISVDCRECQRAVTFRLRRTGCQVKAASLQRWIFLSGKAIGTEWTHGQIPVLTSDIPSVWINRIRLYSNQANFPVIVKCGKAMLNAYLPATMAVFRMWFRRVSPTLECGISNCWTISHRALQAPLAELNYVMDTRLKMVEAQMKVIGYIGVFVLGGVLSVAGYHFGLFKH